ncbi:MAG: hypothetical protein J6Y72_10860 [Bacteroidales bacterium]|nr:hypothetical protein [Bacteroidales bacterium]
MKKLLFALLLIAIIGCQKEQQTSDKTIFLNESNLPPMTILEGTIVESPDSAFHPRHIVYNDSILFVIDSAPEDKFLTVYNLNNGTLIAEYYSKGEGPNEMISPIVLGRRNELWLWDIPTNKHAVMFVDSVIEKGNSYQPQNVFINSSPEGICWFSDSLVIVSNGAYFDKLDCPKEIPEFLKFDGKTGEPLQNISINDKFNPFNVTGAALLSNPEKNLFFAGYYNTPKAAFFDTNMNLVRVFIGPEPDDAEYEIRKNGEVDLKSNYHNYEYYGNCTCDDKYIFICNCHEHNLKIKGIKDLHNFKRENSDIYVFNWEGNFIARIKSKMPYLFYGLSYCDSSKTLYATVDENNADNERFLVKFDLSEILK